MAKWPLKTTTHIKKLKRVKCKCGHPLPWHQFTLDKSVGKCMRKKQFRDPRLPDKKCKCTDFVLHTDSIWSKLFGK